MELPFISNRKLAVEMDCDRLSWERVGYNGTLRNNYIKNIINSVET